MAARFACWAPFPAVAIACWAAPSDGRVRGGSGEDAGHHADVPLEEMPGAEGDARAEKHHDHGQRVELEPVLLRELKNPGPNWRPTVKTNNTSPNSFRNAIRCGSRLKPEMAEQESAEQHPRDAELHAADFDAAEQQPEDRRQGNHQNGLGVRRNFFDAREEFGHGADLGGSSGTGNAYAAIVRASSGRTADNEMTEILILRDYVVCRTCAETQILIIYADLAHYPMPPLDAASAKKEWSSWLPGGLLLFCRIHPANGVVSRELGRLHRLAVVFGIAVAGAVPCHGQNNVAPAMRLDFRVISQGKPLELQADGISRFDFLLSEISLQKEDGAWLAGEEWFAFISVGGGRLNAETTGSPQGAFKAIRFRVGLDEKTDLADPAQWPPGHPLHPDVNHLHWSWQGGYIHLAVEGKSAQGPFSYHLARAEDPMMVTVPVSFRGGGGPVTVNIDIDADEILSATKAPDAANSTHSRQGDALAAAMKAGVRRAFRATGVSYDLFQSTRPDPVLASPLPAGTQVYPSRITRRFPQVTLPPDNPLTEEGVALGKRLFFDPVLSVNGTQSCSSCHQADAALPIPGASAPAHKGQPGNGTPCPCSTSPGRMTACSGTAAPSPSGSRCSCRSPTPRKWVNPSTTSSRSSRRIQAMSLHSTRPSRKESRQTRSPSRWSNSSSP